MDEKSKTVALCLVTWNEIVGCQHDVPLIDRSKFDYVFCVDGGSTDGTVEYLTEQKIPVIRQTSKGINQAYKDGAKFCGCDNIIYFLPKGTVPVTDTYKFRAYFDQGYDVVVASRMMKGAVNEEDSQILKPRKWFVLGLGLLSKILFKRDRGNTIWDTLHGFKGVNVEAFKAMDISDKSPSIDIEIICRSYKLKLKRIEFPTQESARLAGETHFKAFSAGSKMLQYIFWEIGRKV